MSGLVYDTTAPSPDPLQADGLVLYEYPQCSYTIFLRSPNACGVLGDPFDIPPAKFGPATNFGFVVLGAALTVVVSFTYSFGDKKGAEGKGGGAAVAASPGAVLTWPAS